MPLSRTLVQAVRKCVAEEPQIELRLLARELGAKETDVVTALPIAMRRRARKEDFAAIWGLLSRCGQVGVALPGPDGNVAFEGVLTRDGNGAAAARTDGAGAMPLVRDRDVGAIWFVARPLREGQAHAVQFYGEDGELLLAVSPSSLATEADKAVFDALPGAFGVTPVPRMRCRGKACGQCRCGKQGQHH